MRTTRLEVNVLEFQNNVRKIKEYVSGNNTGFLVICFCECTTRDGGRFRLV